MKIEYCENGKASPELFRRGLDFIHRRFLEEWNFHRIDVTEDTINARDNLITYDNGKIVGWLGIEDDGELTNVCVEKGYRGSKILVPLIYEAFKRSRYKVLFAYVPIESLSSAKIFIRTGMVVYKGENPVFIKLVYPEREIVLIKITKSSPMLEVSDDFLKEEFEKLKEVAHAYASYNIPKRFF